MHPTPKSLALATITILPVTTFAQVVDKTIVSDTYGEKRLSRTVVIKDERGLDTTVKQNLIELENGDLLYIHAAQPQSTRDLDVRICRSQHPEATVLPIAILGPETLSGIGCHMPLSDDDDVAPRAGSRLPSIQAIAPGPYAVPVNQNSIHVGRVSYRSDGPATITGEVVVDGRCRTALSDYVSSPANGQTSAAVNCYMSRTGTAPTYTSACVGSTCAADRNTITVF